MGARRALDPLSRGKRKDPQTRLPGSRLPDSVELIRILRAAGRPLKPKEISRAAGVGGARYTDLKAELRRLAENGTLRRVKNGRYAVSGPSDSTPSGLVIGRVDTLRSGAAFVVPDTTESGAKPGDVYVAEDDLGSAMDGDRVAVQIESRPRGKRPSGTVVKILDREHARVVGRFSLDGDLGLVQPMGTRLRRIVLVPKEQQREARPGDIVLVDIDSYGDRRLPPVGRVSRVLGRDHDPTVDALIVIYEHSLPLEFPPDVAAAADEVAMEIEPGSTRVDRSDLLVFTIDPADAKDHDDALSATPLEDGGWEVGIHIADVSWFVTPGSLVDIEAMDRATSVYLVDRVIPMLPHVLSGDLCSLMDGEDRYALSLFVALDADARVMSHRFERTLVRSRASLSYPAAQAILDGHEPPETPDLGASLAVLAKLAAILRAQRLERGSLDFDLPEPKVILDTDGMTVDILKAPRFQSHRLVEEFMLLANQIVATALREAELDPIYRIHDRPSEERTAELRTFLRPLGYAIPKNPEPRALAAVLNRAEGRPEERIVSSAVLRSLKRARYDVENVGHYGLAMDDYAHFTSPIRRYPDLTVHRLVTHLMERKPAPASLGPEALEVVARHSSERERRADRAGQDSVLLARLRFMEPRLGETFKGTVSRATSFGFFVVLDEVFVEGLVHVRSLQDDYYEFDERSLSLVGSSSGRRFSTGDGVRVQLSSVDRDRREIGFTLADDRPVKKSGRRKRRG